MLMIPMRCSRLAMYGAAHFASHCRWQKMQEDKYDAYEGQPLVFGGDFELTPLFYVMLLGDGEETVPVLIDTHVLHRDSRMPLRFH